MTNKNGGSYEFGAFTLDTRQNLLLRNNEPLKLPAKAFELLLFLVQNPNQVIDKETLMQEVWKDSFVEDANLPVHISNLRKILNGDVNGKSAIETFPKVGYRFNADVRLVKNGDPSAERVIEAGSGNAPRNIKIHAAQPLPINSDPAASLFRSRIVFVLLALVLLIGSGFALRSLFGNRAYVTPTIERMRGTEQSSAIAISPNGEYLAHAISKAGKRTLMMTNIGSLSNVELLPADEALYYGMTFTKESSFLYFVKTDKDQLSLYKIPVLGNTATKVLGNVGQKISFSPNGDRFCFVRRLSTNETAIIIANSDGSDQRVLATRKAPEYFSQFEISWSTDGKLIANAAGVSKMERGIQLIGVDAETGREQILSNTKWSGCDGLEWIGDGTGLVAGLWDTGGSPTQVWLIPYPSGQPRKITNDLNNYGGIGVSSDGKTIMAGQFKDESSLWVTPNDQPYQPQPITNDKHHMFKWVRWTPDGRLLFGSSVGEHRDIWVMNVDGSAQTQLTDNAAANIMPTATDDGSFIVFASSRSGDGAFHLWRSDAAGRDAVQLTNGVEELQPDTTPDRQWIFYTSGKMDAPPVEKSIWKVSIEGGEPARFVDGSAHAPDISPDGKSLLCWFKPDNDSPWKAAIFPVGGGKPSKILEISPGTPIHWTTDGQAVSYIVTVDGVSNIWTQPIDGKPAHQTTRFMSDGIFNFDWSKDGRLIASRISKPRDVVLIRNFR